MNLLVPRRRASSELLDDEALAAEEMRKSLRDLERLNRGWGASRALEEFLRPRLRKSENGLGPVLVLDVGAGSGSVTRSLARGLSAAGLPVRAIAVDRQWRHLVAGDLGSNATPAIAADAFRLPLRDASVDWVISNLFLHHFSPEGMICLLRELVRVSRRGFAMLDVRRHLFPLLFVAVAGRLTFETRVSVHDGQASVLQAYTREEVLDIARKALPTARVEKIFPFRLLVIGQGP